MTKFERRGADLFNDTLRARSQMNRFAAAIMQCILARDPTFVFKPMQQRHQRRLFDTEAFCDFRLGESSGREREMQ